MYKTDEILRAAHAIRPNLKELLAAKAEDIEQQLATLLKQADTGEDVDIDIIELLSKHEPSRKWMQHALGDKKIPNDEKSYSPLPGIAQSINSNNRVIKLVTYSCADESPCDCGKYPNGWYPTMIGDCVPNCPKYHTPLIPE